MRELLTRNWLFSDLMPNEVDDLAKSAKLLKMSPGAVVIQRGKTNDSLWIVSEGSVQIKVVKPDGSESVVAELGAGDLLGEMSWLDRHPASATSIAGSAGLIVKIPFVEFEKFLAANSEAHIQILRKFAINLSHRLRG